MAYLKEVLASRELLANLTLREIRGKYKRTVFGQLWSLANPLALMLIYTFVFAFIFRITPSPGDPSGLNVFAVWLLCGLLPWTFVSNVINQGVHAMTMWWTRARTGRVHGPLRGGPGGLGVASVAMSVQACPPVHRTSKSTCPRPCGSPRGP
jgi:hypothetical protein